MKFVSPCDLNIFQDLRYNRWDNRTRTLDAACASLQYSKTRVKRKDGKLRWKSVCINLSRPKVAEIQIIADRYRNKRLSGTDCIQLWRSKVCMHFLPIGGDIE